MKKEQVLEHLIKCYQNDITIGLRIDIEKGEMTIADYEKINRQFSELIIEFTRLLHDIRYCSKRDCPCCPEINIKNLVNELGDHVNNVGYLYPIKSEWILGAIE